MVNNLRRDSETFIKECEENFAETVGKALVLYK